MHYHNVVFLCGARDFHAMDWYKSARKLYPEKKFTIVTDLIEGEGYKKLIDDDDIVYRLLIIDSLLFKSQSKIGHKWRNLIKLLVLPIQVLKLRNFNKHHPHHIYHAHSMYYLLLATLAKVPFIGTPQGSDILIKPYKSRLYRYLSVQALKKGIAITVDSQKMKRQIKELSGVDAKIVQNGVSVDVIRKYVASNKQLREIEVLSIRGVTGIYRIKELVEARNNSKKNNKLGIKFIFPFKDNNYFNSIEGLLISKDTVLGRLEKSEMYRLLSDTKLVFSIPFSDSSPRSVYEAIFCGCIVAITREEYFENLPECMKSRIVLVDLKKSNWFDYAIQEANEISKFSYVPSTEALRAYNQNNSFNYIAQLIGWAPRWV